MYPLRGRCQARLADAGPVALDQIGSARVSSGHERDATRADAARNRAFPYICGGCCAVAARLTASWARERMPSLRYARARVASTVLGLTNSCAATSRFFSPDAVSSA